MSLTYHQVLASAAIRISALVGADMPALETTFNTRPLTSANFQSTVFTFSAIKRSLQAAEEKLCRTIATNRSSVYRDYLASTTGSLANVAQLPSLDTGSKQIIGVWGSIKDATDGRPCRLNKTENIVKIVDNIGSRYLLSYYFYAIESQRIYHTRTNVKIDCCIYDGDAQKTAIDSDTATLLPYAFEEAYINGTVTMMERTDEFVAQAGIYADYFKDDLDKLAA